MPAITEAQVYLPSSPEELRTTPGFYVIAQNPAIWDLKPYDPRFREMAVDTPRPATEHTPYFGFQRGFRDIPGYVLACGWIGYYSPTGFERTCLLDLTEQDDHDITLRNLGPQIYHMDSERQRLVEAGETFARPPSVRVTFDLRDFTVEQYTDVGQRRKTARNGIFNLAFRTVSGIVLRSNPDAQRPWTATLDSRGDNPSFLIGKVRELFAGQIEVVQAPVWRRATPLTTQANVRNE